MSVAALVWVSSLLSDATATVTRDSWSAALASELELQLLMYTRVSRLYLEERDPSLDALRKSIEADIQIRLREVRAYSAGAAEDAILDDIAELIQDYLQERARRERSGRTAAEVASETRATLEHAVSRLEDLRARNSTEVASARAEAERVGAIANAAGVIVAGLIVAGLILVALGVRRRVLRPLLDLHATIVAFRRGDLQVRARETGPRELASVALAFNEMRDALDAQRKGQLAFLAGVAHDLRNPISALKMATSVLREDPSPDDREQTLGIVERQLGRLAMMVDDLLDANRIEAGELQLELADVDARKVARHVVDLYGPSSPAHEVVLDVPEEPVLVHADPFRLEQALGNLVSNAIKYSPNGGRVAVIVRPNGNEASITVVDRGIGIAPEDLDGIFAPFRRRAATTAPGAGLGLSIVRRILEAHGGRIEVESTVGVGSRFTFYVPAGLSRTEAERQAAVRQREASRNAPRRPESGNAGGTT